MQILSKNYARICTTVYKQSKKSKNIQIKKLSINSSQTFQLNQKFLNSQTVLLFNDGNLIPNFSWISVMLSKTLLHVQQTRNCESVGSQGK